MVAMNLSLRVRRRKAGLASGVLFLTAILFVILVFPGETTHRLPCAADRPCLPEPLGFASLGLLLATVMAVLVHRRAARLLAIVFAGVFLAAGFLEVPHGWWADAAAVALTLLCWLVTRAAPAQRSSVADLPVAGRARVPSPGALPLLGRGSLAWTMILLLVGAAAAITHEARQDAAAEQAAVAHLITGEVLQHGADQLEVGLADGTVRTIQVLHPDDYPIGSSLPVRVHPAGQLEPVSEPDDASGWMMLAGFAYGLALPLGWRALESNLARRRLFSQVQPVRPVAAVTVLGAVLIQPPDNRERALAIPTSAFPCATVREAELYGEPATGRWCAVRIGCRVLSPEGPARLVAWPGPERALEPPEDLSDR